MGDFRDDNSGAKLAPCRFGAGTSAMTYLGSRVSILGVLVASACGTSDSNQVDAGPPRCTAHDQCASSVCLPEGVCSDGSNVAYVEPQGTDNPRCTKEMPCPTLSTAGGKQPYIKVRGAITDNVTIVDENVTILADRGAAITSGGLDSVITILGNSQVAIYDLQISGGTGNRAHGVFARMLVNGSVALHRVTISDNAGAGVEVASNNFTLTQSTIRNNAAGGVAVTAQFPSAVNITNNFIYRNGSESSEVGGVLFLGDANRTPSLTTNQLEFNTIVDNQSQGVVRISGGVVCRGGISATGNLIFRNKVPLPMVDPQIGGDCNVGTSLLTTPERPGFATDYHLTDLTPPSIRDAVDCSSSVATDIDGDPRPLGTRCDLGADEYKP